MAEINMNPVTRLYNDITTIIKSLTVKYPNKVDENETTRTKELGDKYLNAYYMRDSYYSYFDYTREDYIKLGMTDEREIEQHVYDRTLLEPEAKRQALLKIRRERYLREYEELNDYYRMLYGYPDLDDKTEFYVTPELSEKYNIPLDMPVHKIGDELGSYFIACLESEGYIKKLLEENPEKRYLNHLGSKRIPIHVSRSGKHFAILSVIQEGVMESTYREFTRCYEKARNYFVSVIYTYQYRDIIPYYDNFIALCIFITAIQQVSMRGIRNSMDREFYDEYMVRLIYETYKVPFFERADEATQKLIVQNLNVLIQRKATDKVFLDLASILGFTEISIYQYYLVKNRKFDEDGRPIFAKKKQININTGKEETVYDMEKMYGIHFQKVDITEKNIKDALTNSLNRVEYSEITYYDPLWWEDDELEDEIWDTAYNYMETKYYGVTIPYRLTELLLQSVVLLRMLMEKQPELLNVGIQLPKISEKEFNISTCVVLMLALASKKFGATGQITTVPSKLIHILEITDQLINKETDEMEVLQFNFDAFSPQRVKETIDILRETLSRREYRVVNGHDVDLRADGTQDTFAPTHMIQWTLNTEDLDELEGYINKLIIPNGDKKEKVEAINRMYENIEAIYYFLSYQMSLTTDMDDYLAIKKFYEVAFYSHETAEVFKIIDEDGEERCAETFKEYLYYKDTDLYYFVDTVEVDEIYEYINHIIYKIEEYVKHVDMLYVMNSDNSPLAELLQILLDFFKSYILDFVNMSSQMIIDWDLENTIRFFDDIHAAHKTNQSIDRFYIRYSDSIHKFVARMSSDDYMMKLRDYIESHGNVYLPPDAFFFDSRKEFLTMFKTCMRFDKLNIDDGTDSLRGTVHQEDEIHFEDTIEKGGSEIL